MTNFRKKANKQKGSGMSDKIISTLYLIFIMITVMLVILVFSDWGDKIV